MSISGAGLGGELRAVGHIERRLLEAAKLGFKSVIMPAAHSMPTTSRLKGLDIVRSVKIQETRADALPLPSTCWNLAICTALSSAVDTQQPLHCSVPVVRCMPGLLSAIRSLHSGLAQCFDDLQGHTWVIACVLGRLCSRCLISSSLLSHALFRCQNLTEALTAVLGNLTRTEPVEAD